MPRLSAYDLSFDEPSRLLIAKVYADLPPGRRAEGLFRGKLISGRGADPLLAPQRLWGSALLRFTGVSAHHWAAAPC